MPPAPIEGSCAASPIATSFDPVCSTTSVSRSEAVGVGHARLVEVDRRVLRRRRAGRARRGRRARRGSASGRRARGCPGRAAARSTRTPRSRACWWPACCSALAAASMTTPLPVPAGPTRIAARSGPVMTSKRVCLLGAESVRRSARRPDRWRARERCSPTSRPRACGELGEPALDRLLAGTHGERRHQPALQREDAALGDHRP